jgi:hypothetical protein
MAKWVGFIDLLALRHAANIDQFAVERLLSNFFEVLTTAAHQFSFDDLTVDILSDSAVIKFSSFDVLNDFYRRIRPEMFLRETYFRLGISCGEVQIDRYNLIEHKNVAGTYFSGAAGMAAYAAQNSLNGAGANFVRPPLPSKRRTEVPSAYDEFSTALGNKVIVESLFFKRFAKCDVEPYFDFTMSAPEIGSPVSLSEGSSLAQILDEEHSDNDGFVFFDEVYSKYAYTKGLDRFIARKYLNIFFVLLDSIDFSNISISSDGEEFSNVYPSVCRIFFDRRFRGMDTDEDFGLVMLRGIAHILNSKMESDVSSTSIRRVLDDVPELRWACSVLGRKRKTLYRRLGACSERVLSMRTKDLLLRGMTELGYAL